MLATGLTGAETGGGTGALDDATGATAEGAGAGAGAGAAAAAGDTEDFKDNELPLFDGVSVYVGYGPGPAKSFVTIASKSFSTLGSTFSSHSK
jgi:hypothetical protein